MKALRCLQRYCRRQRAKKKLVYLLKQERHLLFNIQHQLAVLAYQYLGGDMKTIKLSDYTHSPGGRRGPGGADVWRQKHLWPAYLDARASGEKLHVVLDVDGGLPPSFLHEAFAGLVLYHEADPREVLDTLQLLPPMGQPSAVQDIQEYIRDARS